MSSCDFLSTIFFAFRLNATQKNSFCSLACSSLEIRNFRSKFGSKLKLADNIDNKCLRALWNFNLNSSEMWFNFTRFQGASKKFSSCLFAFSSLKIRNFRSRARIKLKLAGNMGDSEYCEMWFSIAVKCDFCEIRMRK